MTTVAGSGVSRRAKQTSLRARRATHNVFAGGRSIQEIEDLAVRFCTTSMGAPHIVVTLPRAPGIVDGAAGPRPTPRSVFDGRQADLRHLGEHQLLAPPVPSTSYRPGEPVRRWLERLVYGSPTRQSDDQYARDLGIDLDRHGSNLRQLRDVAPALWTSVCRARLRVVTNVSEGSGCRDLTAAIARDHALVMAALNARMLAEYLRRLAAEPMGPRLDDDEPLWPLQGRLLLDHLVGPAGSIDRLLELTANEPTAPAAALQQAVSAGVLACDPRLLGLARRVQQRCAGFGGTAEQQSAALVKVVQTVREQLVPIKNIRHTDVRDSGLGRQSFAQARLGLTVPQAVTVLAMNLVALPGNFDDAVAALHLGKSIPIDVVPPVIANTDSRIRRIASVLKIISGCDRHQGDTSTDPDNKAGRKLLHQTRVVLDQAECLHGLALLRLDPGAWLR